MSELASRRSFLKSAALLRRQLKEVQCRFDPQQRDPALQQIILVGHSMGGLVSKLQVSYSGEDLWQSISQCPLDTIQTGAQTRAELYDSFFFTSVN